MGSSPVAVKMWKCEKCYLLVPLNRDKDYVIKVKMSALELLSNHCDYTVGKYLYILNIDEYWQVLNMILGIDKISVTHFCSIYPFQNL